MKKATILTCLLIFLSTILFSQEEKKVSLKMHGYLNSLQSAMFDSLSGPVLIDNLFHNRLNFAGYFNENISVSVELRNRLFSGGMINAIEDYPEMIGKDEGLADLSWNWVKKNSFFLNTTIDRLYLDFNYKNLQVTVGRQRINWGQTLVWNPNDIFNAYSFFDFDYVERPGSDAIRLQYYPTFSSALEFAIKSNVDSDITAAGFYRFSRWGYDIQLLAGYFNGSDFVAGVGWSGSIGSVSFRGESSWFHPVKDNDKKESVFILTSGIDKAFKNNSMLQIQAMYCNFPLELKSLTGFYFGDLSAKTLAFSKFTAFSQFTWSLSPLMKIGASAMVFPDLKGFFIGPVFDYSLSEKVDFSAWLQHFDATMGDAKQRFNQGTVRIKYSF
jgi:hypothetical protein